ncbi:DUF2812 domain-containing protein [Alteribacter natronophilus]|uniref:DUF2812 domain-containing protein n=1 Tax=Alteribacter natronophilus TaxID=2583810 RepID=UPI00110E3124|nr:DUF2812 domain-containing protein [Alteribacter natronophilus]TMW71450.1 DUF2812 domain-containing protein [Alteribacter natronophilus]
MRKFRPYWSYDIQKTEQWLGKMAEKGWHFTGLSRKRRVFTFEEGRPASKVYKIGYEKIRPHALPRTLKEDGWKMTVSSGRWFVLAHKGEEAPATSVVRDPVVRRNRIHYYVYWAFMFYIIASTANFIFLTGIVLDAGGEVTREPSPFWAVTYTGYGLGLAFLMSAVFSLLKIRKTNAGLLEESGTGGVSLSDQPVPRIVRGERKAVTKIGWMYKPDLIEEWLEKKEASGWHLHRVSWPGVRFHFIKDKPRQVSMKVDYQNLSREAYDELHREAGWENAYASRSAMMKLAIWRKEYGPGEEKPELFTDPREQTDPVRKMAFTYTVLFLPMVLMYLFFGSLNLEVLLTDPSSLLERGNRSLLFQMSAFAFATLTFSWLIIKIWRSYFRLRRKMIRANM